MNKVLVAGDEHEMRDLLSAVLIEQRYEAIAGSNGEEAQQASDRLAQDQQMHHKTRQRFESEIAKAKNRPKRCLRGDAEVVNRNG